MIITKRKFFLSHARIILDDAQLEKCFREKNHHYITGLSYHKFNFGPGISIKSKKTMLISLRQSIEQIFEGFNANTRNEVRRATEEKELLITCDDRSYDAIYDMYMRFEKEQGRVPHDRSIFLGSKVFSAYYKGELISAIICYDAKPILRSRANFSKRMESASPEKRRIISRATRRLIYEICLYGKEHDYEYFDQGSVNLTDPRKKFIGEFKSSFGGELVDEYSYEYRDWFVRVAKIMGL